MVHIRNGMTRALINIQQIYRKLFERKPWQSNLSNPAQCLARISAYSLKRISTKILRKILRKKTWKESLKAKVLIYLDITCKNSFRNTEKHQTISHVQCFPNHMIWWIPANVYVTIRFVSAVIFPPETQSSVLNPVRQLRSGAHL